MCEQGWPCVHIRQRSEGWACKKRGGDRQKCSVAGAASHVVVPHRRRVSPLATGTGTRPTTETVAAKPSQRVAQLGVAKARRTMAVLRGCCRLLEADGQAIRAGYTGRPRGRQAGRQTSPAGQSVAVRVAGSRFFLCVVAVRTSRRRRMIMMGGWYTVSRVSHRLSLDSVQSCTVPGPVVLTVLL